MRREVRLIASITSGVIALALVLWYGSSVRAEAEYERQKLLEAYGGDVVSVCVASRDIEAGETLDEGNVHLEEWVAGLLPQDAATSIEEVAGMRVTSNVPARAALCPVYFEEREGALEIPDGRVAVSVAVDVAHAAGGAVAPGDTVDVYLSGTSLADRLCRAQIIATSVAGEGGAASDLSWVTLAVEPERVSELLIATSSGTISLVVPGDGAEPLEELDEQQDDAVAPTEPEEERDGLSSDEQEGEGR